MIESLTLTKVIEWSVDDQCFIGHCPGIIGPCCHGDSREQVERELRQIVEEWLEIEGGSIRIESPVTQTDPQPILEFPQNDTEFLDPGNIFIVNESFEEEHISHESALEPLVLLSKEHERGLSLWEIENQLQDITSLWPESGVGMIQERVNDLFHQVADVVKSD